MYGLFSVEAAENFALNKKCIKFARCLKRREFHTVDVAQLVRGVGLWFRKLVGSKPIFHPQGLEKEAAKRVKSLHIEICKDFLFSPTEEKTMKSVPAQPYP